MNLRTAGQRARRGDKVWSADFLEGEEARQRYPNFALDRRQHGDVSHRKNLRIDREDGLSELNARETSPWLALDFCYFRFLRHSLRTAYNFDSACNSCRFPKVCRMDPLSPVIRIGAENPMRLASRREKEKTDAVCPDDLPHTGRVRHAEE